MKTYKAVLPIALTYLVMIAVCAYFLSIYRAYDGGVDVSFVVWAITLPLGTGIQFWQILTGRAVERPAPKLYQKIIFNIIILGFIILGAVMLYRNPYSLPAVLLIVLLVVAWPLAHVERRNKKTFANTVIGTAVAMVGVYILGLLTVILYLQIVSPLTVLQAEALVDKTYGEGEFEFIGRLDYPAIRQANPQGVYFFAPTDNSDTQLEVAILTGEIVVK